MVPCHTISVFICNGSISSLVSCHTVSVLICKFFIDWLSYYICIDL